MSELHYTEINQDYAPVNVDFWQSTSVPAQGIDPAETLFTRFQRKLGYRFRLVDATFPTSAAAGGNFTFSADISNDGYGGLIHQRPVFLVFDNGSNRYNVQLTSRRHPAAMARLVPELPGCGQHHEHSDADREAPICNSRGLLSPVSLASGSFRQSPVHTQLFDPSGKHRHLGLVYGVECAGDRRADQQLQQRLHASHTAHAVIGLSRRQHGGTRVERGETDSVGVTGYYVFRNGMQNRSGHWNELYGYRARFGHTIFVHSGGARRRGECFHSQQHRHGNHPSPCDSAGADAQLGQRHRQQRDVVLDDRERQQWWNHLYGRPRLSTGGQRLDSGDLHRQRPVALDSIFLHCAGSRCSRKCISSEQHRYGHHGRPCSELSYRLRRAERLGNRFQCGDQCHEQWAPMAINGWTLTWTWAGNQSITSAYGINSWNQGGPSVTFSAPPGFWDATISPGQTLSYDIGLSASYSGTNASPTVFLINGMTCQ